MAASANGCAGHECRPWPNDVIAAKKRARQEAAAVENLVGKFAPQHQVVRDALAGFVLGRP
jgi:hypothetical protein